MEFKVISDDIRTQARTGPKSINEPNPLFDALKEGQTIFIAVEKPQKLQGLYQSAKLRGYKMNLRKTVEDSVAGCAIWWNKVTTETETN